jgi:hypothetical protein
MKLDLEREKEKFFFRLLLLSILIAANIVAAVNWLVR